MSVEIKHYGKIDENGKKIYYIPELYRSQIDSLRGYEFVEIVKKKHQKVTQSQHGYYRGCILPICHKTNRFLHFDKKDDIHDDYFAPKFLGYVKVVEIDGKVQEQKKVKSLENLSKEEMTEFIERVISDSAYNGIVIPQPEEFYNRYYQK